MINGVNQATFYILPMLGKHPDEYPRFRDCFTGKTKNWSDDCDSKWIYYSGGHPLLKELPIWDR